MSYRKIVVDEKEYKYKVGRGSTNIRDLETWKSISVSNHILKGITPNTFERGQHKKTSDGMVLPSEVSKWIKKCIF